MSKGYVSYRPEGRLGNALFQASAAMAFAWDHGMEFSMPTTSRDSFWCPTYLPHLAAPDFDPALPTITIEEKGYPFQKLAWDESWREGNIVLNGFWQSEKYWSHHREEVLKAFDFPWVPDEWFVAVHVRRGDYLVHVDKHPVVSKEWYLAQMEKFPAHRFMFFSDDMEWVRENFKGIPQCHFDWAFPPKHPMMDTRPEVVDLVSMSCCEHLIGSASTFAAWAYFLNRTPYKRGIFPKDWIVNGWQGTSEETWRDVLPPEVERA